ncbi:hypothetical protein G7050_11840 [Dysgonomonas sp. HDW5A]|nr:MULTISPECIES: hypothetical protein [unclassified Dysgonomonas]QIK55058.1 hypothetical protein G7051_12190 [Dysgonomonas sp. HDW5B]QIK60480.1 hypothetical protein G7050_11840 [Dysgonomonas sp. HDW5A]
MKFAELFIALASKKAIDSSDFKMYHLIVTFTEVTGGAKDFSSLLMKI